MSARRAVATRWSWVALPVAVLLAASPAAHRARPAADFGEWARAHAIPIRGVDEPYVDSSFRFLDTLVGSARIVALGELIHRGHEPLEFRNEVVRYAVTHLRFTAIALESGLTEMAAVDSFVQGGRGVVDSVLHAGFNWNFGTLPENRELVLWLRAYNAQATRKVHLYGFDLTGGDPANLVDLYVGAPKAVTAAVRYLEVVDPATSADFNARLAPFMARFTPDRYREYSGDERRRLGLLLDRLDRTLIADSVRDVRATSPRAFAQGERNAWMARRLDALLAMSQAPAADPSRARNIVRDSLMAENVRWILGQEGEEGRVMVWAHNAHVINAPGFIWQLSAQGQGVPVGPAYRMAGQYLRAWYGTRERILLSTTSQTVGFAGSPADASSFDAALATVGLSTFVLDLRAADGNPAVRAQLSRPWPFRLHTMFQAIVPREAADAVVYFDRVTATKDR